MESRQSQSIDNDGDAEHGHFISLAILSLIVGVFAGVLAGSFRLFLTQADAWRNTLIGWAHGLGPVGFPLIVVASAVLVGVSAWIVRCFAPRASGSGIPDVEAVLVQLLPPPSYWRLLPIKFVGGVLAIGSGLALGREGPSVQMGADAAHILARAFKRTWPDSRALIAAGAGAGLATAFNAPLAGAIFVLEELYKRFEPRIAMAALGASMIAIAVSRLMLGDVPDFQIAPPPQPAVAVQPLFIVLGLLAGVLAVLYNSMLLGMLGIADRFGRFPVELRAALVGAAVGILAWFAPAIVGGGETITQGVLNGSGTLAMLPLLYAVRLLLSTVSYAAGTPGGLFAPMLVLGAQSGLFFGLLTEAMFPGLPIHPESFAVVGMAALFTGIVRAPLTGVVLTVEMTASVTLALPMMAACCAAMMVASALQSPPIYDSLRARTLSRMAAKSSQPTA